MHDWKQRWFGIFALSLIAFAKDTKAYENPLSFAHSLESTTTQQEQTLANFRHVVRPGDNLTLIATQYATTIERIQQDNSLVDPDKVYAGQVLFIQYPKQFEGVITPVGKTSIPTGESPFVINGFNYLTQRYADLRFENVYYFPGELDNLTRRQEGLAHSYGYNAQEESLNFISSSGKPFDPNEISCAYWMAPIGSQLKVTYRGLPFGPHPEKDISIICPVKDRGPNRLLWYSPDENNREAYQKNVIIDLTPGAANALLDQVGLSARQVGEFRVKVDLVSTPPGFQDLKLPTKFP
ncbi:LysM peptidoglycan-binding domain-containing protein [Candidatus Microgenomates bacterium]|nr:LysM peptidoglycan-binding domain-containing protein [Candidatus Microgenomates bacterium]